jgi:hypothetical protein
VWKSIARRHPVFIPCFPSYVFCEIRNVDSSVLCPERLLWKQNSSNLILHANRFIFDHANRRGASPLRLQKRELVHEPRHRYRTTIWAGHRDLAIDNVPACGTTSIYFAASTNSV